MSKSILIPNGIVTFSESKAICPHCTKEISFDEIEKKWMKQDKHTINIKCACKRKIGIAQNIKGDFVAFDLDAR